MNEKNIMSHYLSDKSGQELDKIYKIAIEGDDKLEVEIYNNMLNIINKYSSNYYEDFYSNIIISSTLQKYIELNYNIILKINNQNGEIIHNISDFINKYTDELINNKLYIVNKFEQSEIIEEGNIDSNLKFNFYTKLLQVFSVMYRKNVNKDSFQLYEQSKIRILKEKADKISSKILDLNDKIFLINQVKFVNPTNGTMRTVYELPSTIVDNESDFKELVSSLYKLLWETNARKEYDKNDKLTFINDLRRYYFHDLEHGRNNDADKKTKRVKDFFTAAIGKCIPETAKEWQSCQEYIYDLIIDYLDNVEKSL